MWWGRGDHISSGQKASSTLGRVRKETGIESALDTTPSYLRWKTDSPISILFQEKANLYGALAQSSWLSKKNFFKRLKEEETCSNIWRQWAFLYPYWLHLLQSILKFNSIQSGLWCITFEIPPQDMKYLQLSSPDQEKMAAPSSTHIPHLLSVMSGFFSSFLFSCNQSTQPHIFSHTE